MKILVTGGSGFIGANLCSLLLKDQNEVFCLDNFYSSSQDNIRDLEIMKENSCGIFHFLKHDILDSWPSEIFEADFDQIYHLACPASPPKYQKDHIYTLDVNYIGTKNVLDLAKSQFERSGKSPTVLFTSTSEVYGDPLQHPQDEEYRGNTNPHGLRSCYDEGKRVAESLCMNYSRQFNLPVRIVRIFNTYGPKMDPEDGRVVSNFIMQALKGETVTIYGDGQQTRSFQYIDDLLTGMLCYMNLKEDFPGPINLGNDKEFTILELVELIEQILGISLKIEFLDLPEDDPKKRCPNVTLAKSKLDWTAKVSLEEGLKKTIDYFQSFVVPKV